MTSHLCRHGKRASSRNGGQLVQEQRTVIKFYVKLGKNMPEIKEDLQKVYGDSRFTNSCIHKWFHRFSDGRKSVKDDPISAKK